MIDYQQELNKELIKYQKFCQETAKSITTPEIIEQLNLLTGTVATIQELIKQNIVIPPELDLAAAQNALREFREIAPTEQQIQAAYKDMEKLAKCLSTVCCSMPSAANIEILN